ncbi:MAG: hypothetical protein ACKOX7_06545 [Bacteroidota bacterium]
MIVKVENGVELGKGGSGWQRRMAVTVPACPELVTLRQAQGGACYMSLVT